MSASAVDIVKFCLNFIKTSSNVLGGDLIQLEKDLSHVRNAKQTQKWLKNVKTLLGNRKYNEMKMSFENSIIVDVGFVDKDIPQGENEVWLSLITQNRDGPSFFLRIVSSENIFNIF